MTGSIQTSDFIGKRWKENHPLNMPFTNNSGGRIEQGQEVFVNGDGTVALRTTGAQYPIGTVSVGNANLEQVTISTNLQCTVYGRNPTAAAIAAGTLVRPNGVMADNRFEYVPAVAGDLASAIVLRGGDAGAEMHVGILRGVHVVPV